MRVLWFRRAFGALNRLVSAENAGTDCTVNVLGNPGNSGTLDNPLLNSDQPR